MEITKLQLFNFRNYQEESFEFSNGLNVLIGKNAQGKTNALEAVLYFAIGKSFKNIKDKELIYFGKENGNIKIEIKKKYSKLKIDSYLFQKEKKSIKINSIPIKRIGELFTQFNAVYFAPDELRLVKETPQDRRRFMDIDISQTSKVYFYNLGQYEKVLANRNKLLKDCKNKQELEATIDIWNRQLALIASNIILYRLRFLKALSPIAQKIHSYLTDNQEILSLSYTGETGESKEDIYNNLLKKLEENFEKDYALGHTGIGPHRDDIKIKINDKDVKLFASQGQQRTCALSLKLSELEIMENASGEKPVLLLDDVLSELDETRKLKLLKLAKNYQTILTTNEFNFDNLECTIFVIENGKIAQKIQKK